MIDTDCNEERLFVRHAYILGANDHTRRSSPRCAPRSTRSRPFPRPRNGAAKAINHLGKGVMKVFAVGWTGTKSSLARRRYASKARLVRTSTRTVRMPANRPTRTAAASGDT